MLRREPELLPDAAERYGRHTLYRVNAVRVATLLTAALREGRPLRLNWREADERALRSADETWPTGVIVVNDDSE